MRPNEAERLLNALRNRDISARDLSGEQYQAIIFHQLIARLAHSKGFQYEFLDNYQGAVDFVIQEKPSQRSKLHFENAVHVFECKHYRRTLELSTVAKLLVVGVRFQPSTLNVVSGTNLQPQVYDYARVFFGGLGNDAAMFRRTFFKHYRTGELLDLEVELDVPTVRDEVSKSKAFNLSWVITELRPFSEKIVASSLSSTEALALDTAWSYRVDASLFTKKRPEDVRIWIETSPAGLGQLKPRIDRVTATDGSHAIRFSQVIDSRHLSDRVKGFLAVHASYRSRSHQVSTVPLLTDSLTKTEYRYPDLHRHQVSNYISMFRAASAPRMLLLGGQAGVGKTTLCENIATELKLNLLSEVDRFSADPITDTSLLHAMLTTICTPAAARADHADEWIEVASSLVAALAPVKEEDGATRPALAPLELVIPVLAELLVRTGPRLLVLRDTHLINEETTRALRALFSRLDDLGWGDLHCILEHRTADGTKNPHWTSLETFLRESVNGVLQWHLNPLTRIELNDYLSSLFSHITPELETAIWEKCGGVALYVFSLLDLLKSENAIRPEATGQWRIEAPSAFFPTALTKSRADGVLENRLRALTWTGAIMSSWFVDEPLALVAFLGLAREPTRVKAFLEIAEIGQDVYQSIRRNLLRQNIIHPTADTWTFEFQHELLSAAALELGRQSVLAHEVAEQVMSELMKDQTASNLEFCGDLAAWMGFPEDAVRAFNGAFERLKKTENFIAIRRILQKLCHFLKLIALDSSKTYVEYLACRSALAWATWNTGSLIEARKHYSAIAADALENSNKILDSTVAENSAANAMRRVVGIDLELGNIPIFLKSTRESLKLKGDSIVFNSLVNRLVLFCSAFSYEHIGLLFARSSIDVFGDPEPESSGAVICSDIGSLFRAAAPKSALELYYQGVELASDLRQRIHNELDVLITEALLGIRIPNAEDLAQWRQRLVNNGLRSMLVRIDFFSAALALQEGHMAQAQRLHNHVENTIAVYRNEQQQIDLLNDKLVASLLEGNQAEVKQFETQIVSKLTTSLKARNRFRKHLQTLLPEIEAHAKRFAGLKPLDINIPRDTPAYSGLLIHVLLNMENLGRIPGVFGKSTLKAIASIWPADIDHSKAMDAFLNQLQSSGLEYKGVKVALCSQ